MSCKLRKAHGNAVKAVFAILVERGQCHRIEPASRDKLLQAIADIGGFPQKGVNKTTQILVVGQQDYRRVGEDGMSSKQEKAMALKDAGQDIEIMSEEQFLSMLGVELHE